MTGIIKHPHITEKAMDLMDFENALQFIVDIDASKPEIRDAVERRYDVDVEKITTQITMDGTKKATVRFAESGEAEDIASRIGVF